MLENTLELWCLIPFVFVAEICPWLKTRKENSLQQLLFKKIEEKLLFINYAKKNEEKLLFINYAVLLCLSQVLLLSKFYHGFEIKKERN